MGSGVTHTTGGVVGTLTGSFPQEIAFSGLITDPILFFNFTDATTSLDFGALSLTLLDSNNAQLVGSTVNFVGSANGFNDGFAARVNGTFGPGTPIDFTMFSNGSVSGFDSFGFTVGVAAVPEPSTLALAVGGLCTLGARRWRRRRAA